MKSVAFRREREATWIALEGLVERVERRGLDALPPEDLERLPSLYRATLSSLSVARAVSLDRNVLDYLESLSARAYFCVYGRSRPLAGTVAEFARRVFPARVRAFRRHLALAAALLALGTAAGLEMTRREPEQFYAFVPADVAQGRGPAASTLELRAALYRRGEAGALTAFAAFLFTHNARVGLSAAALGFVAGLPAALLLFDNGLTLGAFGALYAGRGLGLEFWAWVLPHGVTELLAVALCGAAGLAMAEGLLFPGRHARLERLAQRGREASALVVGAVAMFLVAGLIEGVFRQAVADVTARLGVAAASSLVWLLYFARAGRRRAA